MLNCRFSFGLLRIIMGCFLVNRLSRVRELKRIHVGDCFKLTMASLKLWAHNSLISLVLNNTFVLSLLDRPESDITVAVACAAAGCLAFLWYTCARRGFTWLRWNRNSCNWKQNAYLVCVVLFSVPAISNIYISNNTIVYRIMATLCPTYHLQPSRTDNT